MRTYATAPLGIFQLLSTCFRCYWPIFKDIWRIVLVGALLFLIQATLMGIDPTLDVTSAIIAGLIAIFLQALLLLRGHRVLSGQPITLTQAVVQVKPRYLPLLGWMLLMMLLGIAATAVGTSVGTGLFMMGASFLDKTITVAVLLSIALVLVSIVFVYWYFCVPLIVLDNTPARKSFGASFRLIRHHWWRVSSILFTFFLLGAALQLLMAFVNVSLGIMDWNAFMELPQQAHGTFLANVIANMLHVAIMVLFYPLGIAVTLTLFNDLKLRQKTRIALPRT